MKILKSNGTYRFYNFTEINETLEPGNYTLKQDMFGFYLEETTQFKLPEKIYGNVEKKAERYLKSFDRNINIGILLNGEKGSGKTLLSKMICIKSGLPVIQIDTKYKGVEFFTFINNIEQKCIILIDEFDKIYPAYKDEDDINPQLELLKLMDGGFNSQKMFIFTSNELTISEYMVNRPSRIRYKEEFDKIEEDVVREILRDKLDNIDHLEEVIELYYMYYGFNLDTLLILIEEINFMNESPKVIIKTMNIVPEASYFTIDFITQDGVKFESSHILSINPIELNYIERYWFSKLETEEGEKIQLDYNADSYDKIIGKEGVIWVHHKDKSKLVFKKHNKSKLVF